MFTILATDGRARRGVLYTVHGDIQTPVFMNVGTCAAIKGGLYALFDTAPAVQHDFVATIRHTCDWIGAVWLPQNGYRRSGGFELESYVESGRDYSERIYIPLIKE